MLRNKSLAIPILFSIFLFLSQSIHSFCQDSIPPTGLIDLGYGSQWPIASQLTKRYGQHGIINIGATWIHKKWETGPSMFFLFGSTVKEDVLSSLRGIDGELIGSDHQLADVNLKMRGMLLRWNLGREIKLNNHALLVFNLSPGWLAHWIRFQNPGSTFEPIQGENRYGYDRLSTGFALSESIIFRYHSNNRLINFELAAMMTQSNTPLRRNIQFDLPSRNHNSSVNLFGLQARWLLPILPSKKADHIYYQKYP